MFMDKYLIVHIISKTDMSDILKKIWLQVEETLGAINLFHLEWFRTEFGTSFLLITSFIPE